MGFIDYIKENFSIVKFSASLELEDGNIINVSDFAEGETVTIDVNGTNQPLPDGEWTLNNKDKFACKDGKIISITKMEEVKTEENTTTEDKVEENAEITVEIPEEIVETPEEIVEIPEETQINKSEELQNLLNIIEDLSGRVKGLEEIISSMMVKQEFSKFSTQITKDIENIKNTLEKSTFIVDNTSNIKNSGSFYENIIKLNDKN